MSIIMSYFTVHVSADTYVETFHEKLYNACIYIFIFDNTQDIRMHICMESMCPPFAALLCYGTLYQHIYCSERHLTYLKFRKHG